MNTNNSNPHIYSNLDLRKLLIPIIIEQLLSSLMGTVDTMMVSNVGSAAISAVSLVDSINILVIQALSALSAGGAILCSQYLGSKNPRLHMDEVLIALSVSAASDSNAQKALEQLPNLKGCQAHTSVMVSDVDRKLFMKLSIQATFEPKYENNSVIFPKKGI